MKRPLFALTLAAAAAAACFDLSSPTPPTLVVSPILDSLFVGDSLPPRTVALYDANLQPRDPGPVTWSVDSTSAATINSVTGAIHGVGKGVAVVTAHASGLAAQALVLVSRPLDMTLLMDTVFLSMGDTFTLPVAIAQKTPGPVTLRFDATPSPPIYTVDAITGLVTAQGTGGPIKYVARVTDGTNQVADTGAVWVMALADTTGGRFFMTILGTAIRHEGGAARAINYTKANGTLAFRLTDSLLYAAPYNEKLIITRPDSVSGAGVFAIDSLNPQEATVSLGPLNAVCNPPRPWAVWLSVLPQGSIRAYSHPLTAGVMPGSFSVTRYTPVSGGFMISGRYLFTAQRGDLYTDPLGIVTIRGTFVAPLILDSSTCH